MGPEATLVLGTLARYYRRAPLQAVFLLLGLMLGVIMLTGIHAVNERARASYAEADAAFGAQELYRVEPVQVRGTLDQGLYVDLRRAGVDAVLPVLEADLIGADGMRLRVTGVDPLALPDFALGETEAGGGVELDLAALITPPFEGLLGRSEARRLGIADGAVLDLAGGRRVGPVRLVDDDPLLANRLLLDIGAVQDLAGLEGRVSWISVFALDVAQREALVGRLPQGARLAPMNDPSELEQLTRSFHLNLTAMAMLAFIVGLFIVYNAVNFTVLQRRVLIARLRMLGVSRRSILLALFGELLLWVLAGTGLGFAGGLALADRLGPAVGDTLENLYDARLVAVDLVRWRWFFEALAMTLLGAAVAGGHRLWTLARTPPVVAQSDLDERRATAADYRGQGIAAIALLAIAVAIYLATASLVGAFAVIACVLLAGALLLPGLLLAISMIAARLAGRRPLLGWLAHDAGARMGRLGVAMMAFLLAMAANVGINTMVGSFRLTFLDWLDQRLNAQVYVRPEADRAAAMVAWLTVRPGVERVAEVRQTNARIAGVPSDVVGMDAATIRSTQVLGERVDDVWSAVADGAVLISEKVALETGVGPGDTVTLADGERLLRMPVAGIAYDYGNPEGRAYLDEKRWTRLWPGQAPQSLGIYLEAGASFDMDALREAFDLPASRVIDQAAVKALSVDIFERTFAITRSMNALTLLVAGVGLFCALLATESARYRQLAQLRALGVSAASLRRGALAQVLFLTVVTVLAALPVGIALAWLLVNSVNVTAFGWTFPLRLFPADYLRLAAVALGVAVVAALLPAWRQGRVSCGRWLQAEAA